MFIAINLFIPFILSANERYEAELKSTTEWEPIRVHFDIEIGDQQKKEILQKTADSISEYLNKLLKVHPCKYIKLNQGDFTEQTLNDIDFYVLIKSLPPGDDAAASTQTYRDYKNDYRPKAILIKFALDNIISASTVDDNPRDLFELLIHEVFHGLGISESLFQYWIEPDSNTQYIFLGKNPTHSCKFEGINHEFFYVSTKNIREFIKRKYGDDDFGITEEGEICESGIELEDDGGEGSKGKHPEMRVFPFEIMSASHAKNKKHSISELTLTLLNSSGYYQVNFDMAEPYHFGFPETNYGKPINHFMSGVPAKTWPSQYQCDPERYNAGKTAINFGVCSPDLRSRSSCKRFQYNCNKNPKICEDLNFVDPFNTGYSGTTDDTDYIAFPEPSRDCSLPITEELEEKRYGSTVGESAVCLISNARNQESGWTNPEMLKGHCFRIECDEKFTSYSVILADGSKGICREKGQNLTLTEGKYIYGYIECNDPYWTCLASNNYKSFDVDETAMPTQEIEPTVEPTPEPELGPTVDDSNFTSSSSKIKFTNDGYMLDENEVKTTGSTADVILIKMLKTEIDFEVDPSNKPSQKIFVSPTSTKTKITVIQPENGDFGEGQIGIHDNGQNPTVIVPSLTVPINFFSDKIGTVTVQINKPESNLNLKAETKDSEPSSTLSLSSLLMKKGDFTLLVDDSVEQVEYGEVTIYEDNKISSMSSSNRSLITTVLNDLYLGQGSSTSLNNVNVKSKVVARPNAKVTVSGKVTFGSESVISLTHFSLINLTDSTVEGVSKSISMHKSLSFKSSFLLSDEENLICGINFKCNEWLSKFVSNSDYKEAKCVNTTENEMCLVAVRNDNTGGKSNGKNKTVVIAVVVVVVVVVIAAVAVAVFFILKKKREERTTKLNETIIQSSTEIGI